LTVNQSPTNIVNASTLNQKLILGYQGWFGCPGDNSKTNQWLHWFQGNTPDASSLTVDMWPDTSEYDTLFQTNMTYSNGQPASLYSAFSGSVVDRHFAWMQDNNLDGVMLQRFNSELHDPAFMDFRDQVAKNVRAAAEAHGRVFCIMYDISGNNESSLVGDIENDWTHLVDDIKITESQNYLKHKEKNLLAIWGLGFTDRPGTASQASEIVDYFKNNPEEKYRSTVFGGVPSHWRTLDGDSKTDSEWSNVYRSFDVVSPWSVGRFVDSAGADSFRKNFIDPDLSVLKPLHVDYMPVVFPGFSMSHITMNSQQNLPLNQIPRNGGSFWWRQVYNAISSGCTMIYGAMFDEVDEGTAMFKIVTEQQGLPMQAQDRLVYLNIDGKSLPNDYYLWLADQGSRMLRGEIKLTQNMPTQDQSPPRFNWKSLLNRRS